MPITVAMIEEKEFKTKMRGYDPVEVDEFLDEICDEMVAMQEEIATLNSRLSQANRAAAAYTPVPAPAAVPVPAPAPTPIPEPAVVAKEEIQEAVKTVVKPAAADQAEETSAAASKLLARAQKVYDETVAEAKAEAEEILKNANERANIDIEALEDERESLKSEIEMLKAAAKDYKARFLALIEDQQHVLKAENELFE